MIPNGPPLSVKKRDVLLLEGTKPRMKEENAGKEKKRERERETASRTTSCTRVANHDDSWRLNWYSHAWLRLKSRAAREADASQDVHNRKFLLPRFPLLTFQLLTHIYARDRLPFHLTSRNPTYITLSLSFSLLFPSLSPFSSCVLILSRRNTGMHK